MSSPRKYRLVVHQFGNMDTTEYMKLLYQLENVNTTRLGKNIKSDFILNAIFVPVNADLTRLPDNSLTRGGNLTIINVLVLNGANLDMDKLLAYSEILNITKDAMGEIKPANNLIPIRTVAIENITTSFLADVVDPYVDEMMTDNSVKANLIKTLNIVRGLPNSGVDSLLNKNPKPDPGLKGYITQIANYIELLELKPSDLY